MKIMKFFKEQITFDDLKDGAIFLYEDDIFLKVCEDDESRVAIVLESEDFKQFEVRYFMRDIIVDKVLSAELTLYD